MTKASKTSPIQNGMTTMSDTKKVTLGDHVASTHRNTERVGNVVTGDAVAGDVVPGDEEEKTVEKTAETSDAAEETPEGGEDS